MVSTSGVGSKKNGLKPPEYIELLKRAINAAIKYLSWLDVDRYEMF